MTGNVTIFEGWDKPATVTIEIDGVAPLVLYGSIQELTCHRGWNEKLGTVRLAMHLVSKEKRKP